MKYLQMFESFFKWQQKLTEDEALKCWRYFYDEVFPEERVKFFNEILRKTFIELDEFIEVDTSNLRPYFGLVNSREGGSTTGLSYEFQSSVNNRVIDMEKVNGWSHLFRDAMNSIKPKKATFSDEIEHAYPYYEWKLNIKFCGGFNGKSKEELDKMFNHDLLGDSYNDITKLISKTIKQYADHYGSEIRISTKTYGTRGVFGKNTYAFEIWIQDLDFEPKNLPTF